MPAPVWTLLAPDAPEPGPLSVVRNEQGRWFRDFIGVGPMWRQLDASMPAWAFWTDVIREGPVHLAVGDDVLTPLTASTEPSPYEVRRDALNAAVRYVALWASPADLDVREVADQFEQHLTRDA